MFISIYYIYITRELHSYVKNTYIYEKINMYEQSIVFIFWLFGTAIGQTTVSGNLWVFEPPLDDNMLFPSILSLARICLNAVEETDLLKKTMIFEPTMDSKYMFHRLSLDIACERERERVLTFLIGFELWIKIFRRRPTCLDLPRPTASSLWMGTFRRRPTCLDLPSPAC